MVFSSAIFLFLFFPIIYVICRFLKNIKYQNVWLCICSLIFYSFGQIYYLPLMILNIFINYISAMAIVKFNHKKIILAIAVMLNILMIGIFKYLDFLINNVNYVFGNNIAPTGIILPIGISFYVFQGMSYVIDVYRDNSRMTTSFFRILLYISFFPQLIAGPIVKYKDVYEQIEDRHITDDMSVDGLKRFIIGLSKKLIIANNVGIIADNVYALDLVHIDYKVAILGAVCYTLQIYFDFSGYSDMAIGIAKMFGFKFMENFNLPYSSSSIKEFWRRWHISLSTWFKEYLYIPLGGNRIGKTRTMINKLIVFFVTGVWHGANMTFIIWGMIHGTFIAIEELIKIPKKYKKKLVSKIYTLSVVVVAFIFFRADTVGDAINIIFNIFTLNQNIHSVLSISRHINNMSIFYIILAIILSQGIVDKVRLKLNGITSFVLYSILYLYCIINIASSNFNPFIYFQF